MPHSTRNWKLPTGLRLFVIPFALALFAIAFAAYLAPWMHAGTHPLLVKAELAQNATLEAVLEDGWTAPLVRTDDNLLVTELPPRREYSLRLLAKGGECRVTSVIIQDLHDRPVTELFSKQNAAPLTIRDGESSEITKNLAVSHGAFWQAFAGLFCLFILLFYGCTALFKEAETTTPFTRSRGFSVWQWSVVLALAAVHLWLILTATPMFWTADSIGYASKALALYQRGEYYTNGVYYEILRAPGAPFMEALAWKLFGFSLGSIVLLQGLLYCAVAAFALDAVALDAVARTGSQLAALAVSPFVLLSPPALSGNRFVASEGPFLVFAILASACILRSLNASSKKREWAWVGGATLAAMYAVLVRPNGVILLAFPLFMLGRLGVQGIRAKTFPARRLAILWLIPVAGIFLTIGAWSWRNYCVQKYFTMTDIVGLSAAEAKFKSGVLDIRASCDDEAFYEQVVKARHTTNYNFEAWSLGSLYQKRIEEAGPADKTFARRADGKLGRFAARTNEAVSYEVKAAAFTRIFRWGLFLDKDPNYQPYGPPNHNFVYYDSAEWDYVNSVITGWIHKDLGVTQKPLGVVQRGYNAALGGYKWVLIAGVIIGLIFFAVAAIRGWWPVLVLLLPYFGNIIFNAALGVIVSRYVLVIEPFLWLGIGAGVAMCIRDWRLRRNTTLPCVEEP